jgi:predicted transcriptional regulator
VAKVFISLPDDLLERVDRAARQRSTTRSAFLQQAARHELGWPDADAVDDAIKRGRAALASAGRFDSTELIRSDRDERDAGDRRR